MSITINIAFEQIKEMLDQLSASELDELKIELEKIAAKKKQSSANRLKELLLRGPIMSDEQINEIKEARKRINQWRKQ